MTSEGQPAMRYYEYISVAKVDMLYGQIGTPQRTRTDEFGLDLKVIRASRTTEGRADPSIYDKMSAVEDWIYAHEPVGSPDCPDVWIYGRIPLFTATFTGVDHPSQDELLDGAVFYVAELEEHSWLLMGGSIRHLVANPAYPDAKSRHNNVFPSTASGMRKLLARYAKEIGPIDSAINRGPREPAASAELRDPLWGIIFQTASEIRTRAESPLGECEFLAKRLLKVEQSPFPSSTLATPLFVAYSG